MDLLKDHPELAPNVLKLLSEALTASQLDAQALERRLAEQKSNDASESLNLVLDENAQLRLELDEALKAKEEDAESGGLLLLRIADLESELAQLQSERKRDEMQFHETITAFDSDLSQLRADSAHDKEQVMRSRETIDKARDQWSKNEVAHQQALKALNDRYAELETNRDSLQQQLKNTFAKLESRDRDVQRTTKEKEQIRAEKERYQRDLQALRKASEAERKDRVAVEQSVQSKHTAEVNTLEAEVKRLNQRLKDNDGALKKERNGTKRATNSKVGALEAEVERLEEQLKSLAQNMSAQKDKAYQEVKVVNENLARSREEATELKGCLAKNEATLAALRSEGEAGTRRVSLLSEQLGSLQAKIRQRDEEYDDLSSRYLAFKECYSSECISADGDFAFVSIDNSDGSLNSHRPPNLDTHEGERLRLQESNTELQKDLGSLRTQYLKVVSTRDAMGRHLDNLRVSSPEFAAWKHQDEQVFKEQVEREASRLLYHKFMAQFLMPVNRPSFQSLMPVYTVESKSRLEFFAHDLRTPRPSMHFPMRTHWCGPEEVHALVYNPTHEYWPDVQKCVTPTTLAMQVGVPFDLFVNRRNAVCYAGVYALHSMREVGQFGEPIPPDVSPMAIAHAAGATGPFASKIIECFPDGQIRVECFGLQCLGFDEQLYYALVQREQSRLQSQSQSQAAAPGEEPKTRGSLKRPAESQGGRVG